MPTNGVGNISADPQLASASYLSAQSPCLGAGSASYASGTDIDGEPWSNPPSIGCDEYHAGAVTGPLTVSLTAPDERFARLRRGFDGVHRGPDRLSLWDFGDGDVEVNEPYTSHTWTAPGDYPVSLWAYNDSYPEGVSATLTIHVEEGRALCRGQQWQSGRALHFLGDGGHEHPGCGGCGATGRDNYRDQWDLRRRRRWIQMAIRPVVADSR